MLLTAVIAFREFLEVFLLIGLFLGVSKKLLLKKSVEIWLAGAVGIFLSLLIILCTYTYANYAHFVLTESSADTLESYLLIFSGIFIMYVIFSLHKVFSATSKKASAKTQEKIQQNAFDISLFFTIMLLVVREGFEVALFTATTSLFSTFFQNMLGLFLGLFAAGFVALATSLAYVKISLKRVFQITEYFIILLGASLFQNGITIFLRTNFHIYLSNMLSFHVVFLPSEDTFIGGFLQNFLGLDSGFSVVRLFIMVAYICVVYILFLRRKTSTIKV